MNIKSFYSILAIVFMAFLMGCRSNETSRTTGWNINDPRWGGFQVNHGFEQATPPGMVFVEGGSFVMGANHEDLLHTWDMNPRRVTVASFYMDETEVRNVDYREYIFWLERIFGEDFPEVVRNAWPDELAWRRVDAYVEHMVELYFQHPAFNDYPVVGITWEQAMDYAQWRSDRFNEQLLVRLGFLQQIDPAQTPDHHFNTGAFLAGHYIGLTRRQLPDMNPNAPERVRNVQLRDGVLMPNFRLPTEAEWEYAALGLIGNSFDERIVERRVFPWNGHGVRMTDQRNMGEMRANFMRGRGDFAGVAGSLNDGAFFTANVFSYAPNDFGLFNMAANVAEWVLDVYRPATFEHAHGLNPFRGHNFRTQVLDEFGDPVINEMGRVEMQYMTPEQIGHRRNFQQADNRNFREGDFASVITHDWIALAEAGENTTEQVFDPTTTLVTDRSRVVKGGSFMDGAFWMSPANRRFLEQDLSEPWIGFRLMMPRIGTPTQPRR